MEDLTLDLEIIPSRQKQKGKPVIGFGKSGLINISATFVEKTGIKGGQYVAIAKDKAKQSECYLLHSNVEKPGFLQLREKDQGLTLNCSSWAKLMIEDNPVEGKTGVSFLISMEGIRTPEYTAYAIITKSAH